MDKKTYEKIIQKKEFSNLPKKDVEKVYSLFDKEHLIEEEKIKKTRDMLRKVYFAFGSLKLLNPEIINKKSAEEILKKHISTKERLDYYGEVYERLLSGFKELTIFDLGAGINGLSYDSFPFSVDYIGVEAVGQLVDLMNYYFNTLKATSTLKTTSNLKVTSKNKIKNAKAIHLSLFDLCSVKDLIRSGKGRKVVFLFKTIDSLEMIERNYSKEFLKGIIPLVDKVVVSFATRSLVSKKEFKVKRYWFENFVKEQGWNVLDDFELGSERYIVFKKG